MRRGPKAVPLDLTEPERVEPRRAAPAVPARRRPGPHPAHPGRAALRRAGRGQGPGRQPRDGCDLAPAPLRRAQAGGVDGRTAPRNAAGHRRRGDRALGRVALTLEEAPRGAAHWSTRSVAQRAGMSQAAASRIWRASGLRPHRAETLKLSSEPAFVEKVRDVVGRPLFGPARPRPGAVRGREAADTGGPGHRARLPLRPGQAERRTHDNRRRGTADPFAALDVKAAPRSAPARGATGRWSSGPCARPSSGACRRHRRAPRA